MSDQEGGDEITTTEHAETEQTQEVSEDQGQLVPVDYEPAIAAIPPKVVLQEESQVEVSASPAFQCLDDLFQAGKLTGTKVAQLKAKYTELHETLKSTRDNESRLLQQAKDYSTNLDKQALELEKADNFPDSSNTEVAKLRQQLLKHNNELAQAEERQYQLEYKIECLKEEKKMVAREYERMPKAGEVEKKIEELKQVCAETRKEIGNRKQEIKTLKEDLDTKNRQIQTDHKAYQETMDKVDELKAELVAINAKPGQITKESDKYTRQKIDVDRKLRDVNAELKELTDTLHKLQKRQDEISDEKFDMETESNQQASKHNSKERELNALLADHDRAKEKQGELLSDKATLDLNLRHINLDKKTQHELHSRKAREKDRDLRNLKKAELQLRVAQDAAAHTQTILEKFEGQKDALPKDDGSLQYKRTELQKEVEQTKRALAQQNSLTAVETVKVEQSLLEEERLLYEQSDLRIEVVELTRLAAIKADEREQKARDFMRAEMRHGRAIEDLKSKQLQIQDHQKKYQEMQIKLKDFAKLYDVIKNERNKCVNLIQTSTQKAAEMREKIKILQNEIEILRTAVTHKEKQLQKQKLKHVNSIVIRDSMRNEVAKQQRTDEEMREKRDQQKMDIAKLNMMINQAEEQMVELRKRYETAVKNRTDRGILLLARNEEVCIFYEKVNIQNQMITNGDVEMQARQEEIRFLQMQLAEENRNIDLLRKNLPSKTALEQEMVTLQIQLSQCQDRMLELENQLEDPLDPSRVRFLEGKDATPAELHNKIGELEMRLATKEEHLLEKDLIFQQVTRLSERVNKKANAGKNDTLNLAKKVNDLQAKIKEVTRKMMAMVSELSMHQANALRLQQEVKDKEGELEECYIRMEKGEAPSLEIEREWLKTLRDIMRKTKEREDSKLLEEEEEQYALPGGVTTAAEPRPNAYIPDDDCELPIPRPYGAHAPFKPNEPGSTMRHIRKPIPKPIEI